MTQFLSLGISSILLGPIATGCVYDPNARCEERTELYNDAKCICSDGFAFTEMGCVRCGRHEVASVAGCVCETGFSRESPAAACVEEPITGQGERCDPDQSDCPDPAFAYCQVSADGSGYCTQSDCETDADCEGDYVCTTEAAPSYCRRPPTGVGQPCSSGEDCQEYEATYCEAFVSRICLVQGCSPEANDCFPGNDCCDLSGFGIQTTICVPEGECP